MNFLIESWIQKLCYYVCGLLLDVVKACSRRGFSTIHHPPSPHPDPTMGKCVFSETQWEIQIVIVKVLTGKLLEIAFGEYKIRFDKLEWNRNRS